MTLLFPILKPQFKPGTALIKFSFDLPQLVCTSSKTKNHCQNNWCTFYSYSGTPLTIKILEQENRLFKLLMFCTLVIFFSGLQKKMVFFLVSSKVLPISCENILCKETIGMGSRNKTYCDVCFDFPFQSFPWGGSGKLKTTFHHERVLICCSFLEYLWQAVYDGSHSPFGKAENFLLIIRVAALLPAATSELNTCKTMLDLAHGDGKRLASDERRLYSRFSPVMPFKLKMVTIQ